MLVQADIDDLRRISLFNGLSRDELKYLANYLEHKSFRKDDFIYREDDRPGPLYMIQQGAVEITRQLSIGHRQVIAVILAGQFFGELSFFEKRRHAAQARATVDSELILLPKSGYDAMELENPFLVEKLLREIIRVISANLDSMNDMFIHMVNYTFYGERVCRIEVGSRV